MNDSQAYGPCGLVGRLMPLWSRALESHCTFRRKGVNTLTLLPSSSDWVKVETNNAISSSFRPCAVSINFICPCHFPSSPSFEPIQGKKKETYSQHTEVQQGNWWESELAIMPHWARFAEYRLTHSVVGRPTASKPRRSLIKEKLLSIHFKLINYSMGLCISK